MLDSKMFHQVLIELKAHVTEFQILEIPAILVRHKSNHEIIGYGLGHDFRDLSLIGPFITLCKIVF